MRVLHSELGASLARRILVARAIGWLPIEPHL
jgi:hypothetical protein